MFQALHAVKDRIGVTSARGASADTDGTSLAELQRRYAAIRAPLATALAHIDSARLAPEDQHALGAMRASLAGGLASDADDTEPGDAASHAPPRLQLRRGGHRPRRLGVRAARAPHVRVLHARGAARAVRGKTLDRLTALGMLAQMDDREQRHRLFAAIDTIWRSMNGDDSEGARTGSS